MPDASNADAVTSEAPHEPLGKLLLRFLRFGFLAWGGPAAQIAMIREEIVEEERWISRERFNRVLAVYQVGAFLAGLARGNRGRPRGSHLRRRPRPPVRLDGEGGGRGRGHRSGSGGVRAPPPLIAHRAASRFGFPPTVAVHTGLRHPDVRS